MAKYLKGCFLLFLSGMCLWGCAGQTQSEDARFETFTRELFCTEVSSNTLSLHYTLQNPQEYSIENAPVTLGTISAEKEKALAELENVSAALESFPYEQLETDNRLTYDVLSEYLDVEKEGLYYILYNEPLNCVSGVQTQLPVLLSEFPLEEKADVEIYLQLLEKLPEYMDSVIAFEREKAKQGLFMTKRSADVVLEQCQAFVDMGENQYLVSTFVDRIKKIDTLSLEEQSDFIQKNAQLLETHVMPAYQKLIFEIQQLKGSSVNEEGLCYLPEGKGYYEYVAEKETGSSRTIEELQVLTKEQILKDLEAMEKVLGIEAASTHISQSLSEYSQKRTEEAQTVSSLQSDALLTLANLETMLEGRFPKLPETQTQVKLVPDAMEESLSPAFYMIPEIDNISENVIYLNERYERDEISMFTTLAHEGFPGHLYQTVYFASLEPDPLRMIMDFGGYVEGWATYAEMCSYYLMDIPKEQATFLQKNASIILGLYSLADMGIHYDGWSREETAAFFGSYGIADTTVSDQIYDLILGDPGNYLKYYIGYVEFLELKKEYALQAGDTFSQTEFHKKVLDVGPASFDIVEKYAGIE